MKSNKVKNRGAAIQPSSSRHSRLAGQARPGAPLHGTRHCTNAPWSMLDQKRAARARSA